MGRVGHNRRATREWRRDRGCSSCARQRPPVRAESRRSPGRGMADTCDEVEAVDRGILVIAGREDDVGPLRDRQGATSRSLRKRTVSSWLSRPEFVGHPNLVHRQAPEVRPARVEGTPPPGTIRRPSLVSRDPSVAPSAARGSGQQGGSRRQRKAGPVNAEQGEREAISARIRSELSP
jgi:hypothetical protein